MGSDHGGVELKDYLAGVLRSKNIDVQDLGTHGRESVDYPDFGRLVSQRQLLSEGWGPGYTVETNYLRVYLAGLRRKLEADPSRPRHLLTEPGMGYRFVP